MPENLRLRSRDSDPALLALQVARLPCISLHPHPPPPVMSPLGWTSPGRASEAGLFWSWRANFEGESQKGAGCSSQGFISLRTSQWQEVLEGI